MFHLPTKQRGQQQTLLLKQRSYNFFPSPPTCSAGAFAVIFHVLRHSFIWNLLGEEERRQFFKHHPQRLRDLHVYFRNHKPSFGLGALCKDRPSLCRILVMHNLFFATGRISEQRREIESVGFTTKYSLTNFGFL